MQRVFDLVSFILSLLIYVVLLWLVVAGSKIYLGKDNSSSDFEIFLVQSIEPNFKKLEPQKPKTAEKITKLPSANPAPKAQIKQTDHNSQETQTPAKHYFATQEQIIPLGSNDPVFKALKDEIAKNTIYPRAARRARLSGVVGVEFQIDKSGISNEKISRPSQYKLLNEAALNAIKNTKPNLEKIDKKYSISMEIAFELR
ncbi:energy transducer TonB [Campylobacter porcelli]|uniref:Putative energy transduction protein TonB n=1 Tax=Campylobacter porcelli TaxID=1660073 RepID=A0A1X9SVI0_9BACT|nr:TonB family protein [Campylobacter sp. RM6137]ARR00193.1 putative energy transduction protein TonB [Campylobacter sp. RM6137]